MNNDVCPPENVREYSTIASIDGMLSGVWSEPVIGLSNSSRFVNPARVISTAIMIIIAKFFTGNREIVPHAGGLVLLLNFNSQIRTGTRIIEKTKVAIIPATKVIPTDRMGIIETIFGKIKTEIPITVVAADIRTATPVVLDFSITHDL